MKKFYCYLLLIAAVIISAINLSEKILISHNDKQKEPVYHVAEIDPKVKKEREEREKKLMEDHCAEKGGLLAVQFFVNNVIYNAICNVPKEYTSYDVFIDRATGQASSTANEYATEVYVCLEKYKNTILSPLPVKCLQYFYK